MNENKLEKSDYMATIRISKVIAFIGRIAVILGVVAIGFLLQEGEMGILGIPSASIVILFGLLMILASHITRAIVDTANYSKAMLEELRKKGELKWKMYGKNHW